jgi:hypothetical protein
MEQPTQRATDHKTTEPTWTVPKRAKLGPFQHVRGHGRLHFIGWPIDPHGARFDDDWFPPSRS